MKKLARFSAGEISALSFRITGNLDSKTGMDVIALLKMTSQAFHQTIVMITHNEEIALMADRMIRIEDGKVVNGNAEK